MRVCQTGQLVERVLTASVILLAVLVFAFAYILWQAYMTVLRGRVITVNESYFSSITPNGASSARFAPQLGSLRSKSRSNVDDMARW